MFFFFFNPNSLLNNKRFRIFDKFMSIDPAFTIQKAAIFYMLGEAHEKRETQSIDFSEVVDSFKLLPGTASKLLSSFLETDYRGKQGFNMVEVIPSPSGKSRALAYRLNEAGIIFYKEIKSLESIN